MTYVGVVVAAVVIPTVLLVIACACVIIDERCQRCDCEHCQDERDSHPAGRDR